MARPSLLAQLNSKNGLVMVHGALSLVAREHVTPEVGQKVEQISTRRHLPDSAEHQAGQLPRVHTMKKSTDCSAEKSVVYMQHGLGLLSFLG